MATEHGHLRPVGSFLPHLRGADPLPLVLGWDRLQERDLWEKLSHESNEKLDTKAKQA